MLIFLKFCLKLINSILSRLHELLQHLLGEKLQVLCFFAHSVMFSHPCTNILRHRRTILTDITFFSCILRSLRWISLAKNSCSMIIQSLLSNQWLEIQNEKSVLSLHSNKYPTSIAVLPHFLFLREKKIIKKLALCCSSYTSLLFLFLVLFFRPFLQHLPSLGHFFTFRFHTIFGVCFSRYCGGAMFSLRSRILKSRVLLYFFIQMLKNIWINFIRCWLWTLIGQETRQPFGTNLWFLKVQCVSFQRTRFIFLKLCRHTLMGHFLLSTSTPCFDV